MDRELNDFQVGDKILCIDDYPSKSNSNNKLNNKKFLKQGEIYTVIERHPSTRDVKLDSCPEMGWWGEWFFEPIGVSAEELEAIKQGLAEMIQGSSGNGR